MEAKKSLLKVNRVKRSRISDHPEVVAARKVVEEQHEAYNHSKDEQHKESLKLAKAQLFDVYERLREEELALRIEEVEIAREGKQYSEAWIIVNEVSGRKRSKAGQVKGDTPEDRVKSWFTHFRNLLGDPPTVTGEDLEIIDVLTNVDIDDGPFSMEELRKVKYSQMQL